MAVEDKEHFAVVLISSPVIDLACGECGQTMDYIKSRNAFVCYNAVCLHNSVPYEVYGEPTQKLKRVSLSKT